MNEKGVMRVIEREGGGPYELAGQRIPHKFIGGEGSQYLKEREGG